MIKSIRITTALIVIVSFFTSCNSEKPIQSSLVETGVSKTLATYRKEVISNISYNIQFDIPTKKENAIMGLECIDFDLSSRDSSLQLDFKQPEDYIKQVTVNTQTVPYQFENEHIVIDPQYLKKGRNSIEIKFRAGDLSLNRNDDYLYTLLVPDRARTVFPCFDQPDLKATFLLSLTMPAEWIAMGNAAVKDSLIDNNRKTYHFFNSDTISTYLFSFAAGKFIPITKMEGGQMMTFFHRETDTAKINHSLGPIFKLHGDALAFMEEYTQIPHPYQKFDFVAIPDFQYGGMEHVGAIQYRAATLFLDDGATQSQVRARANLISHETAHMWFGDLVTMKWFNDVWMKEVFANFMADKIAQQTGKGDDFNLKFLVDHTPAAYSVDRTAGANPIRQELDNLQDAGTLYGDIIYHKSPIMMRQLEKWMGEEELKLGLRDYLKTYYNSNATWPDLIRILDNHTPVDLQEWNKVWVNEEGRPSFSYQMSTDKNTIEQLVISQKGEDGSVRVWPQYFEIALVYADRIEEYPVHMNAMELDIIAVQGKKTPLYILFNSTGEGYGLFPVDPNMLKHKGYLRAPLMRATSAINLYENMLNGVSIKPADLLSFYLKAIARETEELNIKLITGQMYSIFWKFLSPNKRLQMAAQLENSLWDAMQRQTIPSAKKTLFNTYLQIASTQIAQDNLYEIWKNEKEPKGVKLSEDDYTDLALALILREYPNSTEIQEKQLERIHNEDRKKRFAFILPALSADVKQRDAFFASLKELKNREKESWVGSALSYLHHPLRASTSQNYLKESLELLEEVQKTGDIFFPTAWLANTFGSYQSEKAKNVVKTFLDGHPDYNPKLKAKILQATDNLYRSRKLVSKD